MQICPMCGNKSEVLSETVDLSYGKRICPECNIRIKQLMESDDPKMVHDAVNYIYTCTKHSNDKELVEQLHELLDNNASIFKELQRDSDASVNSNDDYYEEEKKVDPGFGSELMQFIAWVLWIGGIILSFLVSVTPSQSSAYGTKTGINWIVFFQTFILYLFAGAFAHGLSELFKNVNIIKDKICNIDIDRRKE